MKQFDVKENIISVFGEDFKKELRSAIDFTYNTHQSIDSVFSKKFIGTIVTFNPETSGVEYFSSYAYVNSSDSTEVDRLLKERVEYISNTTGRSEFQLIAIIKASEFEYNGTNSGFYGYHSKEELERINLTLENKYMSLYIDILSKMNTFNDNILISEVGFSIRTFNCLNRAGYNTVGEVKKATLNEMYHVRNLGRNSLNEIQTILNIEFVEIQE